MKPATQREAEARKQYLDLLGYTVGLEAAISLGRPRLKLLEIVAERESREPGQPSLAKYALAKLSDVPPAAPALASAPATQRSLHPSLALGSFMMLAAAVLILKQKS